MHPKLLFLSSILFVSTKAWQCDMGDTRFLGQSAVLNHTVGETNMTISGTMRVVDACHFAIFDFVFGPANATTASNATGDNDNNNTYWYGIRDDMYSWGRICNQTVTETDNATITFSFVDGKGWDDLDTLILYDEDKGTRLAQARLNLTQIWAIRNRTVDTTDNSTNFVNSSLPIGKSGAGRMVPSFGLEGLLGCILMMLLWAIV